MSLSAFFIERPVATLLLAVGLFLAGMVAFMQLPVAPLPRIDLPTINVSAKLPGANPETVAATLAAPLERRLGTIPGVTELTSSSTDGSASIVVQFDLSRNIDGAARDVQAAINASGTDLPSDMPSPPSYRKMNPADAPVLIMAVTSNTIRAAKLYDACDSILVQRISQVEGVAQVTLNGADKPAVRVQVNPLLLASTGLSMETIRSTLVKSSLITPKGSLQGETQAVSIGANDQLWEASDYGRLLLASNNGNNLYLRDVATVKNGVENARQAAWFNQDNAILVIIRKQADANVIETVNRIKEALPQLESWMPVGTKISVLSDRTRTIRASVDEVETTLVISIILVVLVVLFSLGNITATVAASITVPLALSGTFAVMWLLGYSLNNISLLALVISVGFVVDDAIVMIENIARHVEKGENPLIAAAKGAKEISFTVISITVSLIAVFIPLLFMGGVIGRLFKEFAVTLTTAIVLSALISICVTPAVYGHLLARPRKLRTVWFVEIGEKTFSWLHRLYMHGLQWVMRRQKFMLMVMLSTIVLTVALYTMIPKGLFPKEDTGLVMGNTESRSDISFQAMEERQRQVMKVIMEDPAVEALGSSVGGGKSNEGRLYITLKDISERKETAEEVVSRLRPKLAKLEGISTFLQPAQDIRVGGRSSKSAFQFTLRSDSLEELKLWMPRYLEALAKKKDIMDLSSDQDKAAKQVNIVVDRDKAARLNVDMRAVDLALGNSFAQRQVSTVYMNRNQYRVVLEIEPRYQENPLSLNSIFVPSSDGKQIRLSSIARFELGFAPLAVAHQGQFPAATLTFNLPPGASLSDAAKQIEEVEQEIHPPATLRSAFAGNAKLFAESLRNQPMLLLAALLAIYIVLGILYENLLHPLTIISTLPSAGIGALLTLMITGTELSIISIIGIILLMGIVKKNGIMLVDFAIEAERNQGLTPQEAIMQACDKRFRPILMTTLAAVLGAVPLIVAGGHGSEFRQPLGLVIVGGLVVSQLLTLYTTPVVYLALAGKKSLGKV